MHTMQPSRIFVSYHAIDQDQYAARFAQRLIQDLRAVGGDVATDGESTTDATFVQTINREMPNCEWFIFVETPDALQSPRIQMTVNTALNLVAQRRMQEALRVVAAPGGYLPATWARLRMIDASQDYAQALSQLLDILQLRKSNATAAPPGLRVVPVSKVAYDRPAAPPRPAFFKSWGGRLLIAFVALLLLTLVGSLFISARLFVPHPRPPVVVSNPIVGYAHFTSSGLFDTINSQGTDDGVQIDLSQLAAPASDKSYYGWLLPDKDQPDANAILLGKLPVQNGTVHFKYSDPMHANLLGQGSRFLMTEGKADFAPGAVPERGDWRYYAEVPQVQNPAALHLSMLDLLRRLLVSDPQLLKLSLHGGLNIWISQNTRKVLEWATAARGTGLPQDPQLMHRHFVRILDYVDSIPLVPDDVPPGTPVFSDPQIAQVGLLSIRPGQQNPPGYIDYASTYLQNLVDAPGITKDQRDRVGRILASLEAVKGDLEQVHLDARKLVQMDDAQLIDPATIPLLDDLVAHANSTYVGQTDAATGVRQGGTTWIYDSIQSLATIPVAKYSA